MSYLIRIHEATGVPYIIWIPPWAGERVRRIALEDHVGAEPWHILVEGRIGKNKKRRKRGVWQRDPKNGKVIYFTCPWCGAIGTSEAKHIGKSYRDSTFCRAKDAGGCERHLSLTYWREKDMKPVGWEGAML